MIFGDMRDFDRERKLYPAALARALDYLKEADWSKLANGKYEIDGDRMFVNVGDGTTAHASQRRGERHIRYTDVQYVISGEETMGFARNSERQCVSADWSDQDAYLFDELENETFLHLQPGQFVVFLPHDIHRPGCAAGQPGPVRKAIVKIDTELLLE